MTFAMLQKIRYRLCYNYAGKLNKDGRAPVALECRQGKAKIYISSQVMLYPNEWKLGMVVEREDAGKLTVYLKRWSHSVEDVELESLLNGSQMSLSQLKMAYKEGVHASATIEEFTHAVIDYSTRSKQTKAAYGTFITAVNEYDYGAKITDITHDWIERWRSYMRDNGLSENTIKGRLKQCHCITQEAIKREVITKDPFKFITIGNMTAKQEFLTMPEIRKLENVKLEGKEAAVRDLFMLGCWSGLRWSDLSTLEEADISKGVLRKRMYKTKYDVVIPVSTLFWGKGQAIIDRYKPITKLSHCVKYNSTANRIIKEIAERVGIKKPVHFHLARKSCSSNLYQMGLPMQEIQMFLGHQKLETTSKYYVVGKEKSLMKATKKLFKSKETQTQDTVQELPSSSIQTTQPYPCGGGQEILQE